MKIQILSDECRRAQQRKYFDNDNKNEDNSL